MRDNYDTILESRVLRVLLGENKTATGVEFVPRSATDASQARTVSARKEVIVATGTINTPKMLQASGIGPRAVLEEAGIDVVVDLPGVGFNFQDHPVGGGATFILTNFNIRPDPSDLQSNATFRDEAQAEFAQFRTGPLSIASGNLMAFLPFSVISSKAETIASALEDQDPAAYLPPGTEKTLLAGYATQKKRLAALLRSDNSANYNLFLRGANFGGTVVYLHPVSRGTIHVNPANPFFGNPIVDYRAASNPLDLDILAEFVRYTRRFYTETSLSQYGPIEISPGPKVTSDEALREALRSSLSPTCFHPVGTAAMMLRELGGVVSELLGVYGVSGLSVVDASIVPDLPGAYTQQPTYAIAEKAADLIKRRARRCPRAL
ncbi:alcohol oxidase [Emericellopsis cladophorae]|uniref:Alcohol oxidase n=1 Tax=Emericellopsis cladophorae TaxID=2686198 RepID=A0A9P9XYB2_9HYPO|nr:alcohol oxidase [Emericellopsis cladophorae]KAI6779858.1 alcohol oxidase [Emericellopsis cladophorae]